MWLGLHPSIHSSIHIYCISTHDLSRLLLAEHMGQRSMSKMVDVVCILIYLNYGKPKEHTLLDRSPKAHSGHISTGFPGYHCRNNKLPSMQNINKWRWSDNTLAINILQVLTELRNFLQSCVCADFMLNNNFKRVPVEHSRDQQME